MYYVIIMIIMYVSESESEYVERCRIEGFIQSPAKVGSLKI